ncbi:hypothetical protein EM595_2846 [Duffyella gerundensis]|uniref:Uncharacterized protein n=1 Tax=Duffyella gerundensis TaxID=1619313 RepID=A0A0U5L7N5_9GAMM|nr:hypothetical protein EM595_2846 [Duffyella gerundensis]
MQAEDSKEPRGFKRIAGPQREIAQKKIVLSIKPTLCSRLLIYAKKGLRHNAERV